MNGRTEIYALDTNVAIYWTDTGICPLPKEKRDGAQYFISVITEMELFVKPTLKPEDEQVIKTLLKDVTIIPLDEAIKETAIAIRRFGNPRLKLPDAIIAATAVALDAKLLTADEKILKLQWPGLETVSIE